MIFFCGMDDPHNAAKVPAAFVSVKRLMRRKRVGFPVRKWIMDSGAFTTIAQHGGYPHPVGDYARYIRDYATNGCLMAAVAQDYMCEPQMLQRTGLTVADHQRLTIERYDQLRHEDVGGVYIMPVLQGYGASDYIRHIADYGHRLLPRAWIGVGSVCKRNSDPLAIAHVLLAIKSVRPDLRLHGFGLKITALASRIVQLLLFSADSMAWSFHARMHGRDHHDPAEAQRYVRRVQSLTTNWRPA
jgi:hypothetical protein